MSSSRISQSSNDDSLASTGGGNQRVTITLSSSSYEKLSEIAREQSISISEAVRRSIRRDLFIQSLLKEKDGKLLIESPDGREAYILFDE
ncbi:MAG: ribbon-helix-helix protein, CopG family [Leptolyngbyaceae cyanobacterium]